MAEKLVKYYEYVRGKGGMVFQMRLAMKTGMSSEVAKTAPDSPEALNKFRQAVKDVTGESNVPNF